MSEVKQFLDATGLEHFWAQCTSTFRKNSTITPIKNGGTGATTAAGALSNLGAVPNTRTINGKALSSNISLSAADVDAIPTAAKGAASGVASLGTDGKVPTSQLPTLGEVNQNAFSNVKVGSTTIAADSKTDTLTIEAGSNVTITPDASGDKITIAATDTTYSAATTSANGLMTSSMVTKLNGIAENANNYTHPNSGVTAGTYKSVTVNEQGHVTSGSNPTTLSGYGITDAVPSNRTINNKALSNNITLTASDVGALSSDSNDLHRNDRVVNWLDNAEFLSEVVVNQRNASGTIGAYKYCLDRWFNNSNKNGTLTLTAEGIKHNFDLTQILPTKVWTGMAATLAARYTDGTLLIVNATITRSTSGKWNNSESVNGNMISIIDNGDGKTASVRVIGNNNKTLHWMALYEGTYTADNLPTHMAKGQAHELMECQRYYQVHYFGLTWQTYMYLSLPIPMRIAPTATYETYAGADAPQITVVDNTCVYAKYNGGNAGWCDAKIILSADL